MAKGSFKSLKLGFPPIEEEALKNLNGFIRHGARAAYSGVIPTGFFPLDFAMKYGELPEDIDFNSAKFQGYDPALLGLPLGRIVEIFGEESSGKSYFAYRVVGYCQKMEGKALWVDTEHSFSEALAIINGVNIDELDYSDGITDKSDKEYYAENILDLIIDAIKSGYRLIVLDSVANLVPKKVAESSTEQETVALLARVLSRALGKVAHYAAKHAALVIFINQLRDKPGVMFGDPETTPGGRALKHNSSVRLRIHKRQSMENLIWMEDRSLESGKRVIGKHSGLTIIKNRMGPPLMDPEKGKTIVLDFPIYYEPYFPGIFEHMFDFARQLKLINVYQSEYRWKDLKIKGKQEFIKALQENKLEDTLLWDIEEEAKNNGVFLPPEIMNYCLGKEKSKPKNTEEKKDEDNGSGNNTVQKHVRKYRKKQDS